jgi:2-polyprenyl-3-methyl-5-hydroxy-6-metoxy-1,4-benzoquinol methylase
LSNESSRVSTLSGFYLNDQLEIDKDLIAYRYQTLRPYFSGRHCLEMGPADGWMTRRLVEDFEELTVVDGSAELLAEIPSAPNLTKVHAMFEEFAPAIKFDTIIMEHILEHVEQPVDLMVQAKNWIAPGGVFLLGVPNANSLHRLAAVKMGLLCRSDELNSRDLSLGHRRVYTPAGFRADIEAAGLEIRDMGGVFLKPLSNGQIQEHWTPAMVQAFFELGKDFPEFAGEIYAVCTSAST